MTVADRFWSKVYMCPMSGCWLWVGSDASKGYGAFWDGTRIVLAHRYSYFLHHGHYPKQLVDHLCRNRACVNPAHLRNCSSYENTHAPGSLARAALQARQERCPKCGGPYTPRPKYNRRYCRSCYLQYLKIWQANHRRNNAAK